MNREKFLPSKVELLILVFKEIPPKDFLTPLTSHPSGLLPRQSRQSFLSISQLKKNIYYALYVLTLSLVLCESINSCPSYR